MKPNQDLRQHELKATLLDGSAFSLSEHGNSVVVLLFFGRHCADCRRSAGVLKFLHQQYREEGLAVFGFFVGFVGAEDRENIQSLDLTFPVGYVLRDAMCEFLQIPREAEVHGPIHVITQPGGKAMTVFHHGSQLYEEPETELPALVVPLLKLRTPA
jgi:thiol-disulfide isomerase/thioredoxin